jgi:putative tricarboxylic transport membrane protein
MSSSRWRHLHGGRSVVALAVAGALAVSACGAADGGGGSASTGGAFKPSRPATFIVATGVGGGGDLFGRAAAAGISQVEKGVKVGVENHTGGNEVVGASYVLAKPKNPYYVFVANTSLILIPYSIKPPPDYTYRSFTPIAQLASDQQMLVVPSNSKYKSLADLVAAAKSSKIRVGLTSSTGTDAAVARLLEASQNISFQHVILEAGSSSVAGMLAGNVDFSFLNPSEALGQLQAKKLKALAVFSDKRYDAGSGLEDVPTAKEQGIDVTFSQFRGLLGPPGLKPAEVKFWADAAKAWTATQNYKDYIKKNALMPAFTEGDAFTKLMQTQDQQLKASFGGEG